VSDEGQDRSARQALNTLLEARLYRRNSARRLASVAVSILAHLLLTAGVALAPALAARKPPPIEFVQVQIVPLQALGVPEPVQAAPASEDEPQQSLPQLSTSDEADRQPPEPAVEVEEERASESTETPPPESSTARNRQPESSAPNTLEQRRGSPLGSALATSPFGTAVAGFDNPDFQYGYYVDQMLALIGSNWVRPPSSGAVEMMIHFTIQNDGSLTEIELVTSSGDDSFDLAGLRAVRLASPLPPLPRSFPHSSLGVNLIIR
jgi:TonB family protein